MAVESYESGVMARALFMLCASASFRTAVGAEDATAAKAFIIESWGGDGKRNRDDRPMAVFADEQTRVFPSTFAIIDIADDGLETEETGIGSDDYRGRVSLTIYIPRTVGSESPRASIERARNLQGKVRSEIRAQFGSTNCLATCERIAAPSPLPGDPEGADRDSILIPLDIDWSA